MTFKLEKASREKTKLREAIFGPSGSGKTLSALLQAKGMLDSGLAGEGRIAVIDTENRTASKYAGKLQLPGGEITLDFDVINLKQPTIDNYILAMAACIESPILIIDSGSHAWDELLGEVDRLAHNKYRGNTHSAWSEGTPKQKKFINAIIRYPGHLIMTMRSKTEWLIEQQGGKSKPVRIGMAPIQGKGIEYEFDILLELAPNHVATVIKDRAVGRFQDKLIEYPGQSFGRELIEWLNEGDDPPQAEAATEPPPPIPSTWEEMVNGRKLGENARNVLRLYLGDVASKARLKNPGITIDHIKSKALDDPNTFWTAFNAWMNKNNTTEQEPEEQKGGDASTTESSESVPEL